MRRFVGALVGALVLVAAASAAVAPPAAAADSRAVVVIDTGQGSRHAVITFSGTITGIQALQLAGANPVTYGFAGQGAAVCALDGIGHEATDGCLGTPSDPRYWAYFRALDGASAWSYSNQCACGTVVHDGDVEGWRFGTGQQPPFVSFCDAVGCAPPPTSPPAPAPVAPPPAAVGGGTSGAGGGGASAGTGSAGASPGTGILVSPSESGDTAAPGDATPGTTAPSPSPSPSSPLSTSSAGRTGNRSGDDRRSAAGLPRVRDDGGGGSPWGAAIAVAVVAALGALAVFVRRRRTSA